MFAEIAQDIRDFIGKDTIIITCRHSPDYTLDINFLTAELKAASVRQDILDNQWLNVRKWSEKMFGTDQAKLDLILDHYGVDRSTREQNGHGALLDAKLLATVYPKLLQDYRTFCAQKKRNTATFKR